MHRQAVLPQTEGQTCPCPGGQQDGGQGWGREGDYASVCGGKTVSKAQIHKPDGRPHRHSEGKRHLLHNCTGVTSAQTGARAVGESTRHPLCCPGASAPLPVPSSRRGRTRRRPLGQVSHPGGNGAPSTNGDFCHIRRWKPQRTSLSPEFPSIPNCIPESLSGEV